MELAAMTLPRELSAVVSMTAAFLMAKSQYSTVQYSTVQYSTVQGRAVLHLPRGEHIYHGGAEGEDSDGRDLVPQPDQAAEYLGEVAVTLLITTLTEDDLSLAPVLSPDQGRHQPDVDQGHHEGGPALQHAGGRAAREDNLEAEGEGVHDVVGDGGGVQLAAVGLHVVLQPPHQVRSGQY